MKHPLQKIEDYDPDDPNERTRRGLPPVVRPPMVLITLCPHCGGEVRIHTEPSR